MIADVTVSPSLKYDAQYLPLVRDQTAAHTGLGVGLRMSGNIHSGKNKIIFYLRLD